MTMSEREIISSYRDAKRKMSQIGVLADLNVCSKQEIVKILLSAGLEVPKNFLPRKQIETPEAPVAIVTERDPAPRHMTVDELMHILNDIADPVAIVKINFKAIECVNAVVTYDSKTGVVERTVNLTTKEEP